MKDLDLAEVKAREETRKTRNDRFAMPSVVLSLAGLLFIVLPALMPDFYPPLIAIALMLSVILPIVGLVFGIKALRSHRRTLALVGTLLAILALTWLLVAVIQGFTGG